LKTSFVERGGQNKWISSFIFLTYKLEKKENEKVHHYCHWTKSAL